MADLAEKIEQLPPEYRQEAEDFVDYLLEHKVRKRQMPKRTHLSLSWAGALRHLGEQGVTAKDLKRQLLEDRIDAAER